MAELRIRRAARPLTDGWQHEPVPPRGATRLGISFRPLQAAELGLDPQAALGRLLGYPFPLIRLAAYWCRIEPRPGAFCPAELDRQLDAAERAGKQVIVCVGPVKSFGYPEFFVPPHHLPQPLPEHRLITPASHPRLLAASTAFAARLVERYRGRRAIIAWQVEHEAADPLGMEHSWRLSKTFIQNEVSAVRAADPGRPILMNGFLPASGPVALQQWWRTRDQGDSLAMAADLADIVGVDFYPRHALASAGPVSAYLVGGPARSRLRRRPYPRPEPVLEQAAAAGQRLMITEGQAEPWEAVTKPPSPDRQAMFSCRPEDVIATYRQCLGWAGHRSVIESYLFWGAEYWLAREQQGDPRYLRAFARVLAESGPVSGSAPGS